MREDESNWFSRWEEQLPPPEELMPLSQTLITPDLAMAFDIRNPHTTNTNTLNANPQHQQSHQNQHQQQQHQPSSLPSSTEFADSGELGSGTAGEEPARTLKRPRLVWTPQLHKRFVDAVAHLGIKNAVPKTIMQLMSVDGLTRENVASHLQKYRLYLKRMQGISSAGGGGSGGGSVGVNDPATDHLFASSPVPPHFLHPVARPNSDQYMPFVPVPVPGIHHQHQHQQHLAAAQYHRPVGHFGSPPNGHFDNPFLSRQQHQQHQQQHQHQQQLHRIGAQLHHNPVGGYVEDMESGNASGGRKVLTLFPTGDD